MKFLIVVLSVSLVGISVAQAQEIDARQLQSRAAQIFRQYEDEIHTEAMHEFDNMDTNFDGTISQTEFAIATGYGTPEQRAQAFDIMDGDKDGVLSKDELWSFVKRKIDALK